MPKGTKVIDAAERLGIMIPRFCYHPALGSVGACRVCAVKVLESSTCQGIQMSCMIEAVEGMVVSTTDEEAVDFRLHVIEWLMANHPHDCPVCDEGGHCLLQDMTISGGHGLRRFPGRKRTHSDQDLGPLVQHEMNRCIQCYRCTRYYREFSGYRDLGVMGIGSRVYFGRRKDGTLESPFSGNLIDICPTGVYTDKPARYKGRRWDLERHASLCINCSLGCNVVAGARYREVVRQEARYSAPVNGHFICDRGRYGFYYSNDAHRPRSGRVDGKDASLNTSIKAAAEKLDRMVEESGAASVAAAGSTRSSLETLAALDHCSNQKGWTGPSFFRNRDSARKVHTAVSRLEPDLAVSLGQLPDADLILVVGADPVNEAPMLATALRQAFRNGAKIVVIDPRPVDLPLEFQHIPAAPEALATCLGALLKNAADRGTAETLGETALRFFDDLPDADPAHGATVAAAAEALRQCRKPVFVCGTDVASRAVIELAADAALLVAPEKDRTGLFYLLPGANAFGAALISKGEGGFDEIIEGIETGKVRALVLVENDPFWYYPDRQRLERALEKLDLLVVTDYLNTDAGQRADVFVPSATLYESGGRFINQEGRVQTTAPIFRGGLPITQISGGSHPPRSFRNDIPGGGIRPAWATIPAIAKEPTDTEAPDSGLQLWLTEAHPGFSETPPATDIGADGIRIEMATDAGKHFVGKSPVVPEKPEGAFTLLFSDLTFGTEELSRYSPCLQQREHAPCLTIQNEDASALGFSEGDTAAIVTDGGSIPVTIRLAENMAKGVFVLPRHRQTDWQCFEKQPMWLLKNHIRKASGD